VIENVFKRLVRRACARAPKLRGFELQLVVGDAKSFPQPRNFAQCGLARKHVLRIEVAPKMLTQSADRIEAVLRHEIAHAVFFAYGEPDHTERETDQLAEELFGGRIFYDAIDVQTLRRGKFPRPKYLPK
jgi:hypothetical protein